MKREFLTELGLNDEQVNAVMAEHGKAVNSFKEKAEGAGELQSQIDDLNQQIKDRDKQLKDLGKKAEGNEELQQQIKDLQKQNDDTKQEWEQRLTAQRKESKLELALKDAKAKNTKAVKANLDLESIKLDGDKLFGLDDQLKALKESDGYLFENDQPSVRGRKPNPNPEPPAPGGMTKEKFKSMSYQERVKLYNDDPDLYQKLKE